MRFIGTLENESDGRRFSAFLKKKGIEVHLDSSFDVNTGHISYQVWVVDEDRISEALSDLETFVKNPTDSIYDEPPQEPVVHEEEKIEEMQAQEPYRMKKSYPLTLLVIGICAFVYLLNWFEESSLAQRRATEAMLVITPIQSQLLFDVPQSFAALEGQAEKGSSLIEASFRQVDALPFWKGAYAWVMLKLQGKDTTLFEGKLFHQIREGEAWRLFSPAILHTTFLHILFNMIWVWILSRPIEQRIGILRLIFMSLIIGIGSNVAQYLMSGPFFLGYSGVVMGLAGFTWMRERIAPWEGYPLHRTTFLFLLLFVGGMFILQLVSFFLELFTAAQFSPNIANTAHIVGALIGAILGRLSFFDQRVLR